MIRQSSVSLWISRGRRKSQRHLKEAFLRVCRNLHTFRFDCDRAERECPQPAAGAGSGEYRARQAAGADFRAGRVARGFAFFLLTRRPDIRQAEQLLISANAEIGAARAQYFPQIGLTAFFGGQSRALRDVFSEPARLGSITPAAVLPIFRAGQIRSNVRLTEAQQRESLIAYQSTIYSALRDVSDALIGHERTREQRTQQELLVKALAESTRLSRLRYEGGLDSYLQVLDAQRNLFQSEIVLAQLHLLERQSVVRLYRSLGGGWQ